MNEHINPVVEIKRIDSELKQFQAAFHDLLDRCEQEDMEVKRIRFDLDEFKTNVKENKSDKTVNSALKRLDAEFKGMKDHIASEFENIWQDVIDMRIFLNEERFKPVFDRLKELEQEYKQKALEVVQASLANG